MSHFTSKHRKLVIIVWAGLFLTAAILLIPPTQTTSARSRPIILMYHHVDYKRSMWHITPDHFDNQLAYLSTRGYHTISMAAYMDSVEKGTALPDKAVVLTFDDGGADNYVYALPLLKRYHMTATFFIVSGWVGAPEFMTWTQVTALRDAGMEIGAHSITHRFLSRLSSKAVFWEMFGSRLDLSSHLNLPIPFFAYPYNDRNAVTEAVARLVGFRAALAVSPHKDDTPGDSFELPRETILSGESQRTFERVIARGGS